ncbi:MAG: phenylalanine--tRNA ligase subunit alpha [Acholeplasmatales bacterium]|jgi:phenylalanyl-tRNA synthetase alpha chain|nr:phenylalanine--tRNA ligase subunit alpha [Acholeplasmatales bacterium]
MVDQITNLIKIFQQDLAACSDSTSLENLRIKYLAKSGELAKLMEDLKNLPAEEKPSVGKLLNTTKNDLEAAYSQKKLEMTTMVFQKALEDNKLDVTLPAHYFPQGSIHPLNRVIQEVEDAFIALGFRVADGPEVESDLYNFELLGLPKGHPARSMQDTFYITENTLLRSQTSPVQARTMQAQAPKNIRIICPGKTYRRDNDDATHSHQFMQIEGLVIEKGITFAHLLYYLEIIAKKIFPHAQGVRLRPSYFPFTEPSVEVDVKITKNGQTKYIEVLGAGMVSPEVLRKGGYNPKRFSGFAFGVGVERITMLKYSIDNIKNFYQNDLRFLRMIRGE